MCVCVWRVIEEGLKTQLGNYRRNGEGGEGRRGGRKIHIVGQ